jgi:hypothetical protein
VQHLTADVDGDMSGGGSLFYLNDLTFELIPCAQLHERLLSVLAGRETVAGQNLLSGRRENELRQAPSRRRRAGDHGTMKFGRSPTALVLPISMIGISARPFGRSRSKLHRLPERAEGGAMSPRGTSRRAPMAELTSGLGGTTEMDVPVGSAVRDANDPISDIEDEFCCNAKYRSQSWRDQSRMTKAAATKGIRGRAPPPSLPKPRLSGLGLGELRPQPLRCF